MSEIARYHEMTGNVARDKEFETNHEGQHERGPGGEGEVSGRGSKLGVAVLQARFDSGRAGKG